MQRSAADFEAACWDAIAESRTRGYDPTIWAGMIHRVGAVAAAMQLLESGDLQYGFLKLISIGRPDLTVEWAVLRPEWRGLFHQGHLDAAEWRLRQAGITDFPGADA